MLYVKKENFSTRREEESETSCACLWEEFDLNIRAKCVYRGSKYANSGCGQTMHNMWGRSLQKLRVSKWFFIVSRGEKNCNWLTCSSPGDQRMLQTPRKRR